MSSDDSASILPENLRKYVEEEKPKEVNIEDMTEKETFEHKLDHLYYSNNNQEEKDKQLKE